MTQSAALHLDLVRWCSTCADDVFFERPDCADDHGADCPELVCVQCGEAFIVGFDVAAPPPRVGARSGRVA